MRRIVTAALLAAPLLLAGSGVVLANDGPCTYGLGCRGNALRMFPNIHQHGPLYNYGPYYGYPPFEPYGNWNAYLQYTGPVPTGPGPGAYGWVGGGHPYSFGHGNPRPLSNLDWLHSGGFRRWSGWGTGGNCNSCGAVAGNYVNSGNALERYTGYGEPAASAAYYGQTPNLLAPGGVIPVGGIR